MSLRRGHVDAHALLHGRCAGVGFGHPPGGVGGGFLAAGIGQQVKTTWRESWTPGRIVIAGLASGFLVGRAQPLKLAGSGGLLNLVTALSGMLASGSAQVAAESAEQAADAAEGSAVESGAGVAAVTSADIAAIEQAARGA